MEQIVILDFGSQYTQVIARRVRELNVYSTILRFDTPASEIQKLSVKGIILSGGPSSVYMPKAPSPIRPSSTWECPYSASATASN